MNELSPPSSPPALGESGDLESLRLGEIGLRNFEPYLMNRIMARYNASLRSDMHAMGLTTPKMRALAVLSVVDGPTIRELSVFAVVETSTMSRALDALTSEGMVRREINEQDNRSTRVYLTDTGRAAFERLWPKMSAMYQKMFQGIEPAARAAFLATLNQILLNVRENEF